MEKRDCNPGRLNFRGRTFKDSLSCFSFLPQCRTNVVKKLKLITYEKISLRHPCLWFPPTLPCQARERVSRRTWVVPGPARPGNSRATTPCCLPRDSCFSAGGEIEFENRQRKLTSCACAWIPFHVPLAHPLGDAQGSGKGDCRDFRNCRWYARAVLFKVNLSSAKTAKPSLMYIRAVLLEAHLP